MSPGEIADRALTLALRGSGKLGVMVTKKKLQRSLLGEVASDLEESARLIRSALSNYEKTG